jgi:tRNA G10  N-methylase Trm11
MNNASEQSICILGRQSELGLAELESLYGADVIRRVSQHVALINLPASDITFSRLGGSTRLGQVVSVIGSSNWKLVEKELARLARKEALTSLQSGKLHLGISAYGFSMTPAKIQATALTLKKILKTAERSVRVVPNPDIELNTAQVLHNQLATDKGVEVLLIADGSKTIIAVTSRIQDIDSYTLRDRGRPKRDARVGMLPPKLAQIIINYATSKQSPSTEFRILDPFCGTGVVLQESLLMGYSVLGTDLEARMIDYSRTNIHWLFDKLLQPQHSTVNLDVGDATTTHWRIQPNAVATETYLGRPFTTTPTTEVLEQTVSDVNVIIKKFLANIHGQLATGTRLCVAVPAWQIRKNEFRHLPVVDSLEEMGYNRISFEHVLDTELLYYREDQIVARELLVLTRK